MPPREYNFSQFQNALWNVLHQYKHRYDNTNEEIDLRNIVAEFTSDFGINERHCVKPQTLDLLKSKTKYEFRDCRMCTHEHVVQWLYERKNIAISILWMNGWTYNIRNTKVKYIERETIHFDELRYNNPIDAMEAAIRDAVTHYMESEV